MVGSQQRRQVFGCDCDKCSWSDKCDRLTLMMIMMIIWLLRAQEVYLLVCTEAAAPHTEKCLLDCELCHRKLTRCKDKAREWKPPDSNIKLRKWYKLHFLSCKIKFIAAKKNGILTDYGGIGSEGKHYTFFYLYSERQRAS